MKKIICVAVLVISACFVRVFAEFMLDNFDSGNVKKNGLGEAAGTWSSEPAGSEKGIKLSFGPDYLGKANGKCLKIEYNVEPSNMYTTPYCGYTSHLKGGLKRYNFLKLHVRGDEAAGFPRKLVIELKDVNNNATQYTIEGITAEWQEFIIPLNVFIHGQFSDLSDAMDLGLVFSTNLGRDRGAVYVDDISFSENGAVEMHENFTSKRTDKKITVDGSAKSWNMRQLTPIAMDCKNSLEYGTAMNAGDLSAKVYSCWDDDNLYIFANVRDKELVAVAEIEHIQDSDGITLYFDSKNDGFVWGDSDDVAVTVTPDGKARILTADRPPSSEEVRYAAKIRRGGYSEEIAVSWKFLGITPEKGKKLGFTVAVQDLNLSGGTRKARLNWHYAPKPGKVELGELPLEQKK